MPECEVNIATVHRLLEIVDRLDGDNRLPKRSTPQDAVASQAIVRSVLLLGLMREGSSSRCPDVIVFGSLHYDIMVEAPNGRARARPSPVILAAEIRRQGRQPGRRGGKAGVAKRMVGAVGDDDFRPRLLANLGPAASTTVSCGSRCRRASAA